MSGQYLDPAAAGDPPAPPAAIPPAAIPPAAPSGGPLAFGPAPSVPPAFATPYAPGYGPMPQNRSPLQWQAYARAHLEARRPVGQLLAEMAASGVPQPYAFGFLAQAVSQMRQRATRFIVGGLAAVALGVIVTVATMLAAQHSGGGEYLMWWGPVIFGAIAAAYGAYLYLRIPQIPH
jgi:hypothetical protein